MSGTATVPGAPDESLGGSSAIEISSPEIPRKRTNKSPDVNAAGELRCILKE